MTARGYHTPSASLRETFPLDAAGRLRLQSYLLSTGPYPGQSGIRGVARSHPSGLTNHCSPGVCANQQTALHRNTSAFRCKRFFILKQQQPTINKNEQQPTINNKQI
ncbi:hypothetical protein T10_1016 [Trichinella papuae]|uniref:Uncharacterized protein n=1 Tax=Trichinella papuae TaxID=268474 RepID=A0A0V1M251_9BILA|nr:hypothetical protein T10_1016 [Trichinella papuae]